MVDPTGQSYVWVDQGSYCYEVSYCEWVDQGSYCDLDGYYYPVGYWNPVYYWEMVYVGYYAWVDDGYNSCYEDSWGGGAQVAATPETAVSWVSGPDTTSRLVTEQEYCDWNNEDVVNAWRNYFDNNEEYVIDENNYILTFAHRDYDYELKIMNEMGTSMELSSLVAISERGLNAQANAEFLVEYGQIVFWEKLYYYDNSPFPYPQCSSYN